MGGQCVIRLHRDILSSAHPIRTHEHRESNGSKKDQINGTFHAILPYVRVKRPIWARKAERMKVIDTFDPSRKDDGYCSQCGGYWCDAHAPDCQSAPRSETACQYCARVIDFSQGHGENETGFMCSGCGDVRGFVHGWLGPDGMRSHMAPDWNWDPVSLALFAEDVATSLGDHMGAI